MISVLQSRRVLVTRPAGQCAELTALLGTRGAIALPLPLFVIEPLLAPTDIRRVLDRFRDADGWIFTSANAARLCVAASPRIATPNWPPLYAVGAATARVLSELGHAGVSYPPQGSDSEALLALPRLQNVRGRQFLVCTGEGGRDLIPSKLSERGARVDRLALYRRVPVEHPPQVLAAALQHADAVIVSSGEGLQRLNQLAPASEYPSLRTRLLVGPSTRVLELAAQLGFSARRAPAEMSDAALVDCLEAGFATAIHPQ